MDRIVYVNGKFLSEHLANVSVFDRGFLFSDGVYEVTAVLRGQLIDNQHHMNRLRRSLRELGIVFKVDDITIESIQKELIQLNKVDEGVVYIQVTRGVADRDFAYPKDSSPTLVLFTQEKKIINSHIADAGIEIITTEDIRWRRRDIKTVALLAASMAKMIAIGKGADDAWLVDKEGNITEGSSCNAYIINDNNTIITRHLSNDILHGITRKAVLQLADTIDMQVKERPFSVKEACQAKEAFITSASSFVLPVVKINNYVLGDGKPGPITNRLRSLYISMALEQSQRR